MKKQDHQSPPPSTTEAPRKAKAAVRRTTAKRSSSRKSSPLSADECRMLRVIGDDIAEKFGGLSGIREMVAESAGEKRTKGDPVGLGAWRATVASKLRCLTKAGQEADEADLMFPDPKILTKKYRTVEADLLRKKWLYIEEGDLIFGTGKMWDWYLSETSSVESPAGGRPPAKAPLAMSIAEAPAEPSTPSTPTSSGQDVEGVGGVEGAVRKAQHHWQMEAGLDKNFFLVGKLLSQLPLQLFQHPDGGLILVEDGRPRHITTAKELAPLLIDNIRITVKKNNKYHGERVPDSVLNNMLASRTFLQHFRRVEDVVTTPIVLPDFTPTKPGFNDQGGVLYLGGAVATSSSMDAIHKFLDVMEWQNDADRTNAIAAALTVPFRHHFPGGKPFVLVTASKSHAGKGTLIEFIRGRTAKAEISYEDKDWPMQRNLHEQLLHKPEIGVINFDNVRTDSSGRAKLIRTGFLEAFITNAEIVLSSATSRSKPIRTANKFVVMLNTNEGSLSIDLLNRALPIRLDPTGDLTERIAKAKGMLGGDVKHEWLPAHRDQIEAELWGMIDRWIKEGKPLDKSVKHPMGPWAQTVGGILMVNGFKNFLANYSTTRAAADPVREALGILAFFAGSEPKRAGELAKLAVAQGLAKVLLSGAEPGNDAACQRAMGVRLSPYVGETFTARSASERITYRLKRQQGRFGEPHPHYRYTFEEIGREEIEEDEGGLVLEENTDGFGGGFLMPDLSQFKPEVLPE